MRVTASISAAGRIAASRWAIALALLIPTAQALALSVVLPTDCPQERAVVADDLAQTLTQMTGEETRLLKRDPGRTFPDGPKVLLGDRTCGSRRKHVACRARKVEPLLGTPGRPHGSGLGRFRYVVERTLAWFGRCRRLKLCYEKNGSYFQAFHDLAAALICARKLGYLT